MKTKTLALLTLFLTTCTFAQSSQPEPVDERVMVEIQDFDEPHVTAVINQIEKFQKQGKADLWIRINSNGGEVFQGMRLVQAVEQFDGKVTCVVDTRALSMGFFFLESCDTRLATKRSLFMAHGPSSRASGNPQELAQQAELLRVMESAMLELCDKMEMSKDELWAKLSLGDWWFGWEEAIKVGAIDGTITPKELPKLTKAEPAPQIDFNQLLQGLKNQ